MNIESFTEDGMYYTEVELKDINSNGKIKYWSVHYFECDGENMAILYAKLAEFNKKSFLPNFVINILYYRGKQDNRNYIKEYLDLQAVEITSKECVVYAEPGKQTKAQLKKDDVVTILEENKKWLKVNYSDNNIGWIKKANTNY